MRRSLTVLVVSVLALTTGQAVAAPTATAPAAPPGAAAGTGPPGGHLVTLITGDRLLVRAGEPPSVMVLPTPGRTGHVRQWQDDGRLHVVPVDAMPSLAAGRLDPRLFDVTGLVAAGYTDDRTDTVPVIVTHRDGVPASTQGRRLSSVDGVATRVPKATAAGTWQALVRDDAVATVWLDGVRTPTLEHSVPQIGAPAAHAAGYTGEGVTVAVLDSGIDTTHPDLAGRVVAARNFTGAPDGDQVGHGTHVASIVGGSGAASDGRHRGVAYGARLLDGKVCEEWGCQESAILAGMEWAAAEQGADVVNLSLGGPDTPDVDPLEAAVDRLTAQHGTLFVVASGNSGGGPGTVSSPSTADAALSVGAVDRQDRTAPFSSGGPRSDGAVKPELTAPGVDITAAHAAGTPGDGPYAAHSGTSMAAPHVAGAAALLAQQHPDWTAERLRAALIGSAVPNDEPVVVQGAGRVDVAASVRQRVLAEPATLGLPRQQWPHHDDEPLHRSVALHNTGDTATTLTLTTEFADQDGTPAPAGMVTVDATEVTVPAGGTATVGVTVDTRVGDRDGFHGGRLVARTGDAVALAVPLSVEREEERHEVTITRIGRDGAPAPGSVMLIDLDAGDAHFARVGAGPTAVRLPVGRYAVNSWFFDDTTDTDLVRPLLHVTTATTLTMDAREARLVRPVPPVGAGVEQAQVEVGFMLRSPDHATGVSGATPAPRLRYTAQLGPPLEDGTVTFTAFVVSSWARPDGAGWYDNAPDVHVVHAERPHRYFTGFDRRYRVRDFARVRSELNATTPGGSGFFFQDPDTGAPFVFGLVNAYTLPAAPTHHLAGDAGRWRGGLVRVRPDGEPDLQLDQAAETLRAGHGHVRRWNRAPFGPALGHLTLAARDGDELGLFAPLFGDAAGHFGVSLTGTGRSALYRDGELVAEAPHPWGGYHQVPPQAAGYRYEVEAEPGTALSRRVSLAWTFRSEHTDGLRPLPVSVVRFHPAVDDAGGTPGGRAAAVPVEVVRHDGSAPPIRRLTVEVSYDEGATWRPVRLAGPGGSRAAPAAVTPDHGPGAGAVAVLRYPHGPGTVSLRSTTVDRDGNTAEQTVIAAYLLR